MLDAQGRELSHALQRLFRRTDEPLDHDEFDTHARRVFAYAFARVPAYAGYCRARGVQPDSLSGWTDIPAVPTAAFKELTLLAEGAEVEAVFRTSGTTRGPERRGEHHVADLALYRASLRPTFSAFLLPDGARLRYLSLMPPAAAVPDSSLAFMITDVLETFGGPGSAVFADTDGLDFHALDRACAEAAAAGEPVLLLGTSAAFIHWLTRPEAATHRLPDGSRLMDTGGFKGRGRRFDPNELRQLYVERLGVPGHRCVNEYGMTELLSQRYDETLRRGGDGGDERWKAGPPWLRSVAVDPETLAPLPEGTSGLLRHFDLAGAGSVPAVQTEDFGRVRDGRILLEGRAAGAPPRGCSIAMDLLLGRPGG